MTGGLVVTSAITLAMAIALGLVIVTNMKAEASYNSKAKVVI